MSTPENGGSAEQLLSRGQVCLTVTLLLLAAVEVVALGPLALLKTTVALITAFYVVFVGIKLIVWAAAGAGHGLPRSRDLPNVDDPTLPKYTILVPLYHEADSAAWVIHAIRHLRYPTEKMEVLLLLEEDDPETLAAIQAIDDLPAYFMVVIVPDVGPRTKGKACNFGYMQASGERLTIFDGEDRPQATQLLEAVGAFRSRAATARRRPIGCVQAPLSFWNPRQSLVGTMYWCEYVIHFQWVLVGLARLGWIPPLGGTSNHFLMNALDDVSSMNGNREYTTHDENPFVMTGPWDSENLTEDADLAFRLALVGYDIRMFESVTFEEAPDSATRAIKQRSRWLQGYAQTGLVHTRAPFRSMRLVGPVRYLTFILYMLGTPFSLLMNPVTWATTILYVVARLCSLTVISTFIQSLSPAPVFYAGMAVAVIGNACLFYQKLITPLRQQQSVPEGNEVMHAAYLREQQYGLCRRLLLTPLWWAFTSISAYRALVKLLIPSQRSAWDLSSHGHAIEEEAQLRVD